MNEPSVAATSQHGVRSAVDFLDKLAGESDEIVQQLHSAFAPVLCLRTEPQPQPERRTEHQPEPPRDAIPGSELAQVLMRLSERIDNSFRAIRGVIESVDV